MQMDVMTYKNKKNSNETTLALPFIGLETIYSL
jgi:hypothetical protein